MKVKQMKRNPSSKINHLHCVVGGSRVLQNKNWESLHEKVIRIYSFCLFFFCVKKIQPCEISVDRLILFVSRCLSFLTE
jgi:hypothetical protein